MKEKEKAATICNKICNEKCTREPWQVATCSTYVLLCRGFDYAVAQVKQIDIEQIFAGVAELPKEKHKNVLGDKWKYINAVKKALELENEV